MAATTHYVLVRNATHGTGASNVMATEQVICDQKFMYVDGLPVFSFDLAD